MRPRDLFSLAAAVLFLSACASSSDPAYQWLTHMDAPAVPAPGNFSISVTGMQGDPAFLLDAIRNQRSLTLLVSVRDPIAPQPAALVQLFDYATGASVQFNSTLADPGDVSGKFFVSGHTASFEFTYLGESFLASFSLSNVVQAQRSLLFDAQLVTRIAKGISPWTVLAPMSTPRAQGALGAIDGRLYAAAGSGGTTTLGSLEVYDPATNTWTARTASPSPRFVLGSAVAGNSLYLIGGCLHLSDCSLSSNNPTNLVEAYDAAADTWSIRAPMPTPRKETAVGVIDGKIYVATGVDSAGLSAGLEVYDPVANTWSARAPIPTARAGAAAATLNGKLYVMGGASASRTNIVEIYDPATNSWSAGTPMLSIRYSPASAASGGRIYVLGGGDDAGNIGSFAEVYDSVANQWSVVDPGSKLLVQSAFEGLTATAIGATVYTAGGRLNTGEVTAIALALSTPDTLAPATSASQSPSSACGWVGADATVTLTAADEAGGAGVQSIVYVNGDGTHLVAGATASFVVSADGTTAITYYARDKAGNVEAPHTLEVRIDRIAPTSSAGATPQPDGSAAVTITAGDAGGSGVAAIAYFINGEAHTVAASSATVAVSPGAAFDWYATDCAGNQESRHSMIVPGDTTPPTTTASGIGDTWTSRDVTVTLTAVDTGGSGVRSITYGSTTVAGATATFVVTAEGITVIPYFATDNAGNVEATNTLVVRIDRTPPTSTASVSSPADGFVTVTFTGTDDASGVRAMIVILKFGLPKLVLLTTNGIASTKVRVGTTLQWTAEDFAGNVESPMHSLVIPNDATPPTTLATASPAPNAAGWNNATVTVTLTAADDPGGVGVQSITYGTTTVSGATASFDVSAEGTSTISYFATDLAGNAETPQSLIVRLDMTAPAITAPNVTADATDTAGAVVSYTVSATDNSGFVPALDCAPASGNTFPIGATTVNCTATDLAGNSSAASFMVTVNGPSAQTTNLISAIDNLNLPAGTSSSLTSKLQGALDAFASGNTASACGMMNSFIAQTQAQSGKKLTVAQADQLIAAANQIKTAQGCP